ncbi:hypothetical protein C8P66_12736 [Humitalea rosea]|uniref:Uncharacterized protein n=1 Tax=Humitalea rosea TaxID=990373 RepID=A0A2W7IMJ0_9PROT|nr:hypothetical protein [Humitalea rosea]PZW39833.1 hypothetical protein C8P66_12736 [Humitalea rosea]
MWPFRSRPAPLQALSLIPPEVVRRWGRLPGASIAGSLPAGQSDPALFQPNPAFAALLRQVIRDTGPDDPGLRAAAAAQGTGWVYVIDLRTPQGPQGQVPFTDIIAGFEVAEGRILPEGFWANPNHSAYSAQGLTRLDPYFQAALIAALEV